MKKNGKRFFQSLLAVNMTMIMMMTGLRTYGMDSVKAKNDDSGSTNPTAWSEGENDLKGMSDFDLSQVLITDAYYSNSFQKEVDYLTSFNVDKLLAGFRETAAYAANMTQAERTAYMKNATRYSGWETSLIGGHTLGHYLTAMAQAYASPNVTPEDKQTIGGMLSEIVVSLADCQAKTAGSSVCKEGYLFGANVATSNYNFTTNLESQFDTVQTPNSSIDIQRTAWVPWYTMHKIVAGLVDVYELTDVEQAGDVASKLGDWVANRANAWTDAQRNRVLSIEYGGMNDCMYDLYLVTGKSTHLTAAAKFDETSLFGNVLNGGTNVLNGRHANTTIPKFMGALKRYMAVGESESRYLDYAKAFWEMVVTKHSYITGGNSEDEHFGADNILNAERTNTNCETCNTYNMLKLSRELFKITGDVKYADFYENTLINAIMASQDPVTGMSMYFQPMATGYHKVYGTPFDNFWCCTGSGMENFTKLNDSVYYKKDNAVIVNQFLSSELTWEDENFRLVQESDFPYSDQAKFTVNHLDGANDMDVDLRIRIPDWAAGDVKVMVNNNEFEYETKAGYIVLSDVRDGDVIEVTIPMKVVAYNLSDGENTYAFKYGPTVLSAKLGTGKQSTTSHGMNVRKSNTKAVDHDRISIFVSETVSDFMEHIDDHMKIITGEDGELEFTLTGTSADYVFIPHHKQRESYGIYWTYSVDKDGMESEKIWAQKNRNRVERVIQDGIQAGYGQYETGLVEERSISETAEGVWRYAQAGGYFQYDIRITEGEDNYVLVTFAKEDDGKPMKISVGGHVIYNQILNHTRADVTNDKLPEADMEDYYQIRIKIGKDIVEAAKKQIKPNENEDPYPAVPIRFEGTDAEDSARLIQWMYSMKSYHTTNALTSFELTSEPGTLKQSGVNYTIDVPYTVVSILTKFGISDPYGYVTVNGHVIDETTDKKLTLTGLTTTFDVRVYAEDFTTYSSFNIKVVRDYKNASSDLSRNLVSGYSFDNTLSGATPYVRPNKYTNPTKDVNISPSYVAGKIGRAINLSGSYGLGLEGTDKMGDRYTVSFWMRPFSVGGQYDPTFTAGTFVPEHWINLTFDSKIFSNYGAGHINTTPANAYEASVWQHVAVVVDGDVAGSGANTVHGTLYLNGNVISEGDVAAGVMTNKNAASYFGINYWDNIYRGALDDLLMFDKALSAAEVQVIANEVVTSTSIKEYIDSTNPTPEPSITPTAKPTSEPIVQPTAIPTLEPTQSPSPAVTKAPDKTSSVSKVTIRAANVRYGAKSATLKTGDKLTLSANVAGSGSYSKKVQWGTSDKKKATVTAKGVVTAKNKTGTVRITAKSAADDKKTASFTIRVVNKEKVNRVLRLSKTNVLLKKKGATAPIKVKSLTKGTTSKLTYRITSGKQYVNVDAYGVITSKTKPTAKAKKAKIQVACGKKKVSLRVTIQK